MITPSDESYAHQLVAPMSTVAHADPNWQERCYHLLYLDSGALLNMGRSLWPVAGKRKAFVGFSHDGVQFAARVQEPYDAAADPDVPTVAGLRVETIDPLKVVRLSYAAEEHGFSCELEFRARFDPVPTAPLRVEQQGEVVTNYMNFFQSGSYHGIVRFQGVDHEVDGRWGFRDRGWGLRKHEGSPRRGLVLAGFCEVEDEAFYFLLFETASGRRVLTNGWWITASGWEQAEDVQHDLEFAERLLQQGTIDLDFPTRGRVRVRADVGNRLFLAPVGYSTRTDLTEPGAGVFDLVDPSVRRDLEGQTDNGCTFEVEGKTGYGYVETGLGIHARYRPE